MVRGRKLLSTLKLILDKKIKDLQETYYITFYKINKQNSRK